MGFGVPAGIGAQVASGQRSLVLVGDGAFQMTGWELGNCPRLGLDPVVIVLNNQTWEMIRAFQTESRCAALGDWHLAQAADALGGRGHRVHTPARVQGGARCRVCRARAVSAHRTHGAAGGQHAHAAAVFRRHSRTAGTGGVGCLSSKGLFT